LFNIKGSLFLGKCFIDLPSVASTNVYAAQLLHKGTTLNGTIVSTFNQTKGKGAHKNQWLSEAHKNISISIILFPKFLSVNQQFRLNMSICLGITDFLCKNFNESFKIKWPNDIYYKKTKLGGVLIENAIQGNQIKSSIVGIGLNINQMAFDTSLPNPISLKHISGINSDLYELLENLIPVIEQRYIQLQQGNFKTLEGDYLARLYQFNESAFYEFGGEKREGRIRGIDVQGKLLIEFKDERLAFGFNEVVFCSKQPQYLTVAAFSFRLRKGGLCWQAKVGVVQIINYKKP